MQFKVEGVGEFEVESECGWMGNKCPSYICEWIEVESAFQVQYGLRLRVWVDLRLRVRVWVGGQQVSLTHT